MKPTDEPTQNGDDVIDNSPLSFEQILLEEFLINTQNYPAEYHELFRTKFERAKKRFEEQFGNK